jgi:hypothetical protein
MPNPLSKYYAIWYKDCLESAEYCKEKNDLKTAEEYVIKAKEYLRLIKEDNSNA